MRLDGAEFHFNPPGDLRIFTTLQQQLCDLLLSRMQLDSFLFHSLFPLMDHAPPIRDFLSGNYPRTQGAGLAPEIHSTHLAKLLLFFTLGRAVILMG